MLDDNLYPTLSRRYTIYTCIYIDNIFVGFASAADLKDGSWVLGVFDEQASAVLPEEIVFWKALVDCLGNWINDDGFRKQFRTCEFSKIGGIVCRNAGTKRKSRSEAVEEPETKVAEASDDEADADEDDMVLSRILRQMHRPRCAHESGLYLRLKAPGMLLPRRRLAVTVSFVLCMCKIQTTTTFELFPW